jgi:hypothetical protein
MTLEAKPFHAFAGEGFHTELPAGITVKEENPVEDFTIYSFSNSGGLLLQAYVGNHPEFPKFASKSMKVVHHSINRLPARSVRWAAGTKRNRETLIELKQSSPILYLHLWYQQLSEKDSRTTDAIIESINAAP